MAQAQPKVAALPSRGNNHLETVVNLLKSFQGQDYYAYERHGIWHVGLGSLASLQIDAHGKTATIDRQNKQEIFPVVGSLDEIARTFVASFSQHSSKIFGQAGFNYGAHVRGQNYHPGVWPILSLMVPITSITLDAELITVRGQDERQITEVCRVLLSDPINLSVESPRHVDSEASGEIYKKQVAMSLEEIQAGQYTKIILSRAIDLKARVDMPATLLHGLRANTPARSFCLSHKGLQATGFSPELVVAVQEGKVTTEPLAGTRSRLGTTEERQAFAQELANDEKEIIEHILSVKEALRELSKFSLESTVVVEDLMTIRQRGSVQHLGSSVVGQLAPGRDEWDAFNVLFPSITASGIPKDIALSAISRLETRPRELYSGAVLLLDGKSLFEATICLRTVFQDQTKGWIQAGAGIIAQSHPERELTETKEKLASVAPFIVYEKETLAKL